MTGSLRELRASILANEAQTGRRDVEARRTFNRELHSLRGGAIFGSNPLRYALNENVGQIGIEIATNTEIVSYLTIGQYVIPQYISNKANTKYQPNRWLPKKRTSRVGICTKDDKYYLVWGNHWTPNTKNPNHVSDKETKYTSTFNNNRDKGFKCCIIDFPHKKDKTDPTSRYKSVVIERYDFEQKLKSWNHDIYNMCKLYINAKDNAADSNTLTLEVVEQQNKIGTIVTRNSHHMTQVFPQCTDNQTLCKHEDKLYCIENSKLRYIGNHIVINKRDLPKEKMDLKSS